MPTAAMAASRAGVVAAAASRTAWSSTFDSSPTLMGAVGVASSRANGAT
jgi:hypothetical protein